MTETNQDRGIITRTYTDLCRKKYSFWEAYDTDACNIIHTFITKCRNAKPSLFPCLHLLSLPEHMSPSALPPSPSLPPSLPPSLRLPPSVSPSVLPPVRPFRPSLPFSPPPPPSLSLSLSLSLSRLGAKKADAWRSPIYPWRRYLPFCRL